MISPRKIGQNLDRSLNIFHVTPLPLHVIEDLIDPLPPLHVIEDLIGQAVGVGEGPNSVVGCHVVNIYRVLKQ